MRILILFLLLFASPVWAVDITITGTCDMSSITDSDCSPGTGPDLTNPLATDHFIVDGATSELTISGNWTQADLLNIGLDLTNGGSLVVNLATTATEELVVTFGVRGIISNNTNVLEFVDNPGGNVTATGRYLSRHQNPAVTFAKRDTEGGRIWQVPLVLPCNGDCITTPDQLVFEYTSNFIKGDDVTELDINLAAMQAGDVVCLWDKNTTDQFETPEAGHCYEVISVVTGSSPRKLILDNHQGSWDSKAFPHVIREYQFFTLAANYSAGTFEFTSTAAMTNLTADRDFVGRYIRCKVGQWESYTYKILHTTDGGGGGEIFRLASPEEGGTGFLHDYVSGTSCVIGNGITSGEAFYVYRPVIFRSADQSGETDDHLFEGRMTFGTDTVAFTAVVLDKITGLSTVGSSEVFTDVWLRDNWGGGASIAWFTVDSDGATINDLYLSGGAANDNATGGANCTDSLGTTGTQCSCLDGGENPNLTCHLHHGIQIQGGSGNINGYRGRHSGDDWIVITQYLFNGDGSDCSTGCLGDRSPDNSASPHWNIENVHAQYSAKVGGSGGLLDPFTSAPGTNITLTNAVCDDCATHNDNVIGASFGDPYNSFAGPAQCLIHTKNTVFWAIGDGGIGAPTGSAADGDPLTNDQGHSFQVSCDSEMYINYVRVARPATMGLPSGDVKGFSAFNIFALTGTSPTNNYSGNPRWENGMIVRATTSADSGKNVNFVDHDIEFIRMINVAFIDPTATGVCTSGCSAVTGGTEGANTLDLIQSRFTIGMTDMSVSSLNNLWAMDFLNARSMITGGIGGVLLSGEPISLAFSGNPDMPGNAIWSGPVCFSRIYVGLDMNGSPKTALLAATTVVEEGHASGTVGRYGFLLPVTGSYFDEDCGADGDAGLSGMNIALSKSGLIFAPNLTSFAVGVAAAVGKRYGPTYLNNFLNGPTY